MVEESENTRRISQSLPFKAKHRKKKRNVREIAKISIYLRPRATRRRKTKMGAATDVLLTRAECFMEKR